MLQPFHSREDR